MRWAGHVAGMGEKRNAYWILVGKAERNRALEKPSHPWEDNIKIDFREIERCGMVGIDLAQDRDHWRPLVNTVISFQVP
jgi:hypothetical protein